MSGDRITQDKRKKSQSFKFFPIEVSVKLEPEKYQISISEEQKYLFEFYSKNYTMKGLSDLFRKAVLNLCEKNNYPLDKIKQIQTKKLKEDWMKVEDKEFSKEVIKESLKIIINLEQDKEKKAELSEYLKSLKDE